MSGLKKRLRCNRPRFTPNHPTKKAIVLACKKGEKKVIRFGAKGYGHNYSSKARRDYLKRSAGIRDGSGRLTKDEPFSANYWSRRFLWGKDTKPYRPR